MKVKIIKNNPPLNVGNFSDISKLIGLEFMVEIFKNQWDDEEGFEELVNDFIIPSVIITEENSEYEGMGLYEGEYEIVEE